MPKKNVSLKLGKHKIDLPEIDDIGLVSSVPSGNITDKLPL